MDENSLYICTTLIENVNAEVAQLVERDLAKVEVAGSNPVFCSGAPGTVLFFSDPNAGKRAGVVELVDTQDLKSCGPQRPYGFDSRPRYLKMRELRDYL